MELQFTKMQGIGNDFVVADCLVTSQLTEDALQAASVFLCDRKFGIGGDGVILVLPSDIADYKMRIFNADGGEVEACGNATRAVTMLVGGTSNIETLGGMLNGEALNGGAKVTLAAPKFDWESIPLAYPADTTTLPIGWEELRNPFAVNVGNPHVVFFVDDSDAVDLERLGPLIEHDALFPERINVNIAMVTGPGSISLRVWERGVGITRACGTGACATAVAAIAKKLVASPVTVSLTGGDLQIAWERGGRIEMTGDATHVFTGTAEWDDFG